MKIILITLVLFALSACSHIQPTRDANVCSKQDVRAYVPDPRSYVHGLNQQLVEKKYPGISRYQVALVFDCNKGYLYSLYNQQLKPLAGKHGDLSGKIVFGLEFTAEGALSHVQVLQNEIRDEEFVDRLTLAINEMPFPGKTYLTQFVPPSW